MFTAQQELGTMALDTFFEILGFRALEFIISFGMFFAIIYLGLSMMPFFKDKIGTGRSSSIIIAVMSALATSAYTYTNNISIIQLVGPFSIVLAAVLFAIILIRSVAKIRGIDPPKTLTTLGILFLAGGFALGQVNHKSAFTLSAIGAILLLVALVRALIKD
jgi:hypothetical protein